jgi:hypothetical protein
MLGPPSEGDSIGKAKVTYQNYYIPAPFLIQPQQQKADFCSISYFPL